MQQQALPPTAAAAGVRAQGEYEPILINLLEECTDATHKSAHDRSVVLEQTERFFHLHCNTGPMRLRGTGTRHFYIVRSGVIDSPACILYTRSSDMYIVSNGLEVLFQEKQGVFLLQAAVDAGSNNVLRYTMSRVQLDGTTVELTTGLDFSTVWKGAMTKSFQEYKERPGYVLKEAKLQDAYRRQIRLVLNVDDTVDVEAILKQRFLGHTTTTAAAAAAVPTPPLKTATAPFSPPAITTSVMFRPLHLNEFPPAVLLPVPPPPPPPPPPPTKRAKKTESQQVMIWKSVLVQVVLDCDHAQFEAWKREEEFAETVKQVMLDNAASFPAQINYGILLFSKREYKAALAQFYGITNVKGELDLLTRDRWIARALLRENRAREAHALFLQILLQCEQRGGGDQQRPSLEIALCQSDLAWTYLALATSSTNDGDQAQRLTWRYQSLNAFKRAIELRRASLAMEQDVDVLRLLAHDYYGLGLALLPFDNALDAAERSFAESSKFAREALGNFAPAPAPAHGSQLSSRLTHAMGMCKWRRALYSSTDEQRAAALLQDALACFQEAGLSLGGSEENIRMVEGGKPILEETRRLLGEIAKRTDLPAAATSSEMALPSELTLRLGELRDFNLQDLLPHEGTGLKSGEAEKDEDMALFLSNLRNQL